MKNVTNLRELLLDLDLNFGAAKLTFRADSLNHNCVFIFLVGGIEADRFLPL